MKQATGIGPGRPSTGWVGVAMLLAVLPLALAACTDQLMAGRCDKDTPCAAGKQCNVYNRAWTLPAPTAATPAPRSAVSVPRLRRRRRRPSPAASRASTAAASRWRDPTAPAAAASTTTAAAAPCAPPAAAWPAPWTATAATDQPVSAQQRLRGLPGRPRRQLRPEGRRQATLRCQRRLRGVPGDHPVHGGRPRLLHRQRLRGLRHGRRRRLQGDHAGVRRHQRHLRRVHRPHPLQGRRQAVLRRQQVRALRMAPAGQTCATLDAALPGVRPGGRLRGVQRERGLQGGGAADLPGEQVRGLHRRRPVHRQAGRQPRRLPGPPGRPLRHRGRHHPRARRQRLRRRRHHGPAGLQPGRRPPADHRHPAPGAGARAGGRIRLDAARGWAGQHHRQAVGRRGRAAPGSGRASPGPARCTCAT